MMRSILNGKVIAAILVIALLLVVGSFILALTGEEETGNVPALTIIAAPTSTPRILPTLFVPTSAVPTPTRLPGTFGVGAYVQITGTGGDGLRLRAEPGLSGTQNLLGYDSEVYLVVDGPVEADGHTWWKLSAPYDAARGGWAVQDYLALIPSP